MVPASLLSSSSICYCAGVGEDITFDLALIERFGCRVFALDPTPRARVYVLEHACGVDRFHFLDTGLWSEDTILKFYAPRNPRHVSHSVVNLQGTSKYFEAQCKKLSTIMSELGHTSIDLLKLDIEGAEYEVLGSMFQDGIDPRIICVEFDQPSPLRKAWAMVRRIEAAGYSLVSIHHWECTFVRNVL